MSEVTKKLYAELLATMVGAWTDARAGSDLPADAPPEAVWREETSIARVLALHLQESAALLTRAIARLDEQAANRYCDFFLKWFNFQRGLRHSGYLEDDPDFAMVGLGLLRQDWETARFTLARQGAAADIGLGKQGIDLSLRRLFEARRLLLVLALIESAEPTGEQWQARAKLSMRMAVALIFGQALHRGGDVTVASFSTPDDVLERVIHGAFVDGATRDELEQVARHAYHAEHEPDVSGWSFGGFLPNFGLTSSVKGWNRLLTVLVAESRGAVGTAAPRSSEMLARLWQSPWRLKVAAEFFDQLARDLVSDTFNDGAPERLVVDRLRESLGKGPLSANELAALRMICVGLADAARWYRNWSIRFPELTDNIKGAYLRGFAAGAFVPDPTRTDDVVVPVVITTVHAAPFMGRLQVSREELVQDPAGAETLGKSDGRHVRSYIDAWAMSELIDRCSAEAIEEPDWLPDPLAETPRQIFINRVGEAVQKMQSRGIDPAIVLWSGRASFSLRPIRQIDPLGPQSRARTHEIERTEVDGKEALTLHGAPILQRHTPRGRCYVVPRRAVETLEVQAGKICGFDIKADWQDPRDRTLQVEILFTVPVQFREP